MSKSVKIRTDGSPEIGLGHVVRCISLAHMLEDEFEIRFYSREIPGAQRQNIIANGWDCIVIDDNPDFLDKLNDNDIVVLDGYHFDSAFQEDIKDKKACLVCIDDFHDKHYHADIILNHAPGLVPADYSAQKYTEYLLGPEYALLRPEFLSGKTGKAKKPAKNTDRLFICFGGSDFKNLTCKVLSWLPEQDCDVSVVVGNAYQYTKELSRVVKERKDLDISVKSALGPADMRIEMEKADLAIVPASGILFEVIAVGTAVISGYYTDNQLAIYNGFLKEKVFFDAGDFREDTFRDALGSYSRKEASAMTARQAGLIDGNSGKRIKSKFKNLC